MSLVAPTIGSVVSECSKHVYVTGQLGGSTLTVYQNGVIQIGQTLANDASTWVGITPGTVLTQGDLITATQTLGPDTSPQTPVPMEVQGLPADPPAPIFKTHLYGCATCLYLGGMVPGAEYRVMGQHVGSLADELRGSGSSSSGNSHVGLNQALWSGEKLRASYDSCGQKSAVATSQPAEQYPLSQLPPPTINEPVFKCDTNVYGKDCVPGATVTMRREKGGMLVQQDAQCSLGQVNFVASPVLDTGEDVILWQAFPGSDNCAKRSNNSATAVVKDAALMEPPNVQSPLCAGGVIITLTKLRPGAKVTIFHDGKEFVGQAAGMGPQDFMVEPLTGDKDVYAVMEHCGIVTGQSNHVPVNKEPASIEPPVVQDPLFSCTDIVHVSNIHSGALVKVYSASIGLIGQAVVYHDEADILVTPGLIVGHQVFAVQVGCGMTSGNSNVVVVKKPGPLTPVTVVKPLYDCGSHVNVKDVVPGAIVEVYVNGAFAGQATIGSSEGSVSVSTPLHKNDKVKARQRMCDEISEFGLEVTVEAFVGSWQEIPWIATNGNAIGDEDKILAVHAALLKTGKVIFFGGDQHTSSLNDSGDVDHTRLLDCATLRIKKVTGLVSPPSDLFCSGHAQTKDGDLLVAGGTFEWSLAGEVGHDALSHFIGSRDTWVFDAANEQWVRKGLLNTERPADFVSEYLAIWQADNPGASPADITAHQAALQLQADTNDPNARIQKTGGKWYPTVLALPDGRLTCVSGHPREEDSRHNNNSMELYSLATGAWTLVGNKDANLIPRTSGRTYEYPRLFVLSDGTMFSAHTMGDGNVHRWTIGNDADAWTQVAGAMPERDPHDTLNGSAVLLPFRLDPNSPNGYLSDQVLMIGGQQPVTIDPLSAPAQWNATAARILAGSPLRRNHNSVILPTEEIFVEGGVVVENDDTTGVLDAELYNPLTDTWSVLPKASVVRNYHHVALLMPNGAVYVGGSDINAAPGLGSRHFEIEIFKPWYFCRKRPVLDIVPAQASHGQNITVTSPDAATISKAVIVKCGTTTHNFDVDQRLIELPVRKADRPGTLTLTIPNNANIAVVGYYLLFILNVEGVPSEGKFIKIQAKSTCFIASAVYGEDSAQVQALRRWRDERLMALVAGRLFVWAYSVVSPPLARVLGRWPAGAKLVRRLLGSLVNRISGAR